MQQKMIVLWATYLITQKKMQNMKPVLKVKEGKPVINFIVLRDIDENEELLYDYSDNSKVSKTNYPWLSQ